MTIIPTRSSAWHPAETDMPRQRRADALETTGSLSLVFLLLAMTGAWLWAGRFWS